ncbi:MAG TPA: hypothetical protein VF772_23030 [Terriglobales bacterium]
MINNLLCHLYDLALEYGGEVHADRNELLLCFPREASPEPESPKRQDPVPPWPTDRPAAASSTTTTTWEPGMTPNQHNPTTMPVQSPRHAVLNDLNQFLKEQEYQRLSRSLYEDGKKQQKFTTGEMPYRNYPEGSPPSR